MSGKLDADVVECDIALRKSTAPDGVVFFRSESVWIAIEWPHWRNIQGKQDQEDVRVNVGQDGFQRAMSISRRAIVTTAQAGPLVGIEACLHLSLIHI